MTNRAQAEEYTAEHYDHADADVYVLSESSNSYPQEALSELPADDENFVTVEYFPGRNFNPDFGPPSRFNRDTLMSWTTHFPDRYAGIPLHIRHFFHLDPPSLVEGITVRLLVNHMNESPMPEGWHLTRISLGGREHHLFHEFETHEIMLNPYTIALEYVAIDTPWTLEAEQVLMDHADLLFDYFEELLAVSFRVQKADRANGMTEYKNAQLTRERMPIHGEYTWCHVDYVTHLIPFYVNVGTPDDIRFTFQWVPAGFGLSEVEDIIYSLGYEELGLEIWYIHIVDSWLQYHPLGTYSFRINLSLPPDHTGNFFITESIYQGLNEKAAYLFKTFSDLQFVSHRFDGRIEGYGVQDDDFPFWITIGRDDAR